MNISFLNVPILFVLNLIDWYYTNNAIQKYGTDVEYNALIKYLMLSYEPVLALAMIKLLTCIFILYLAKHSYRLAVSHSISCMCLIYGLFAVIPWMLIS